MTEVVEGYGSVVGVGWHWIDAAFGPAPSLAPFGKGCRRYTITLRASPALC
jgi:hypothetical protein